MKQKEEAKHKIKKKPMTKQKKNNAQPNIAKITRGLLVDITSLRLALTEISNSLTAQVKKDAEAFSKFGEKHGLTKGEGPKEISISVQEVPEFRRILEGLRVSANSIVLSTRGHFLVLVSKWDAYMGSILRWVYSIQPDIINSSGRSILYTELREIDNLDAARDKIIEDEVSAVLRESHFEHFAYLEKKLKMTLTNDLDIWPRFIELTQRRHLIAHTDGQVSWQYLQVCKTYNAPLEAGTTLHSKLQIDFDYFNDACDCLAELGFKLSQVLWRKLQPGDLLAAEKNLIDTTFGMIEAEQ